MSKIKASPRQFWGGARLTPRLAMASVAIVGLALSVLVFKISRDQELRRIEHILALRMDWRADSLRASIEDEAEPAGIAATLIGRGLIATPQEFDQFVAHYAAGANSYRSFVWAPLVTAAERTAFEIAERAALNDDSYEIAEFGPNGGKVRAGPRADYFPVRYQSLMRNQPSVVGMDLWAYPALAAAVLRARDQARPAMVLWPSFADGLPGFSTVWPVYRDGFGAETVEERRTQIRGFTSISFETLPLLTRAIRDTPNIATILVLSIAQEAAADGAGAETIAARPVAVFDPAIQRFLPPEHAKAYAARAGWRAERSFTVRGLRWRMLGIFEPAAIAGLRSHGEWAWLLFGLLLTASTSVLVERGLRRRIAAEAMATSATHALTRAGADLEAETKERQNAQAKLAETAAALEALITTAPNAIISLDLVNLTILTWNPGAERMFGYTAAEVVGRTNPLAPPEELKHGQARHLESLNLNGGILRNVLVKRRRKDGRIIDVRFSGASYRDARGRLVGVYVLDDVTEQLALDQQLRQAQKMEAIGNLTGGLAHDFNNLLLIILGNLDHLVKRVKGDPDATELAEAALEAGERGAELTRALLAFARRQPLQPKPIDINALVQGMTKLLRRTLGEEIEIDLRLADGVWQVRADPAQLESALLNLAVNARDAMPRGGRLTIATANRSLDADYASTRSEVEPGDYAAIEVSDTGAGMTAEVQERIFEPFFTTKEAGKGTGLGLAMVFGFAKQSGGHISVYSEVGMGTIFRLYLPRQDKAAAESGRAADKAAAPAGRETILVVDDDAKVRRIVVRNLKELSYRVIEKDTPVAAMAVLRDGTAVDLLFTDVVMPGGVNGFELAAQAMAMRPGLKVLLTSGFPDAALKAGGTASMDLPLLSKPYRQVELARKLREVLDAETARRPRETLE